MSYIRTFQHDQKFKSSAVVAIDFEKIEVVRDYGDSVTIFFGTQREAFEDEDRLVFLEAFAEYARAMQSLEPGPVSVFGKAPPVFAQLKPQPTTPDAKTS